MATTQEKMTSIADSIRIKTGKSDSIVANDFALEIASIDRLMPMTLYPDGLDNGYYGNRAARVAATYHLARALKHDTFVYLSSAKTPLSSGKAIRTENGAAPIDCSTYAGLCLRGIPYENSPYVLSKEPNATWNPSTQIAGMYGKDGWEFTCLDKQPLGYSNIGIAGYRTIRTAADLGEFFYKYGYVIFDSKRDGDPTAELKNLLKPGDLIFWSSPNALDNQKKRFRGISHIAIASENPTAYFEVTGTSLVVQYEGLGSNYENVSLICRPDYRPKGKLAEETPVGINLIHYPWGYGAYGSFSKYGLKLDTIDKETIHISGTATETANYGIKGLSNSINSAVLSPGVYQLSGMENASKGAVLKLLHTDGSDFTPVIECSAGKNPKFTITKETNVIVRLCVSSGVTLDCDIVPRLTRIS